MVNCMKLLGVYINCNFNQNEHIHFICGITNQRIYLHKTLKLSGHKAKFLDCVF